MLMSSLAALVMVALPISAHAHEFWMLSEPFTLAPGENASLTMHVGEHFVGDQIAFSTRYVATLRHYAGGQSTDLAPQVPPRTELPALRLALHQPGTHMVAYDSKPSQVTLSGDKFHAYLHEEGLDHIIAQRDRAKLADTPGRERFRRHVKTLMRVGDERNGTAMLRTGQRLEILPLADPHSVQAGDSLPWQVLFDGKPLAGALLKAWHKRESQTLIVRVRTDAEGKAMIDLPYAGTWMMGVVHMVPAQDVKAFDWDSHWGNLSFELAPRKRIP